MSDIIKMGFKLLLITMIAALALSLTHVITAGAIEEQKINAANEARQAVLAKAESFDKIEVNSEYGGDASARIDEIYAGKSGGEIVGYTFRVLSKGFGGEIEIITGINAQGRIEAIQIGEHEETPGLGAKASGQDFTDHYRDKDIQKPLVVTKSKAGSSEEDIEAITGATITSKAVTNGVNAAARYYNKVLINGGGGQ